MLPKNKIHLTIKPNMYIYLALLLFLIPIPWLLAWFIALAFHEFCHWVGVKLCGGSVLELVVGIGGVRMRCSPMPEKSRLLTIIVGPLGGFILAMAGSMLPRTALCSWALSAYNMLPFSFLDGGKSLEILTGANTAASIEKILLVLLSFAAIYTAITLKLGILPLAIIAGLWLKSRNSPCKPSVCKVQ